MYLNNLWTCPSPIFCNCFSPVLNLTFLPSGCGGRQNSWRTPQSLRWQEIKEASPHCKVLSHPRCQALGWWDRHEGNGKTCPYYWNGRPSVGSLKTCPCWIWYQQTADHVSHWRWQGLCRPPHRKDPRIRRLRPVSRYCCLQQDLSFKFCIYFFNKIAFPQKSLLLKILHWQIINIDKLQVSQLCRTKSAEW